MLPGGFFIATTCSEGVIRACDCIPPKENDAVAPEWYTCRIKQLDK